MNLMKAAAFLTLLLGHKRYVILSHVRPDGDAVGSQLALGLFLKQRGKEVLMITADPVPFNLQWLIEPHGVEVFHGSLQQREFIAGAEAIVVVDTNTASRLGDLAQVVEQSQATHYLIDHHPDAETWFDYAYVRESAAATGELIYELLAAYNLDVIDRPIAQALYVAIMTDTGSFQYNSVTPQVHRIVADLLERGRFNPAPIHDAVFNTRTLNGLRLLGMALETMTLLCQGKLAYMYVSRSMMEQSGASQEDIEGFTTYVLSVQGVQAGLLFQETARGVKVSFRSKGDLAINEWARQLGGGGHRNAAGAFIRKSLQEAIQETLRLAPEYLPFCKEESRQASQPLSNADALLLSAFKEATNQGMNP